VTFELILLVQFYIEISFCCLSIG